ncbi:hypothetical protein NMY22_g17302 [Coprinellus aureogranulatus]|nr:hypothetical protein NMY22_g17302 [Coprinellus aureogranulatus]
MDIENLCKLLDANEEEGKALLQNWKWHRSPCHPDVETDRAVVHVVEQSSEYNLADDGAACRNYDRLYPLTFELDETSRVPIARTAPRNAPRLSAPVYGVGLVLRGDWCRYKSTQCGGPGPHLPMGVWLEGLLRYHAKEIGMKYGSIPFSRSDADFILSPPFRIPHVIDRNLRTCLLAYELNLRREDMVQYAATQQEEDFETVCALLGMTPEEKEIFKGNWKWHRQPCNELVETDTPEPPIPRVFHPPEPL